MQAETIELRREKATLITEIQKKEKKINELMGRVYAKTHKS